MDILFGAASSSRSAHHRRPTERERPLLPPRRPVRPTPPHPTRLPFPSSRVLSPSVRAHPVPWERKEVPAPPRPARRRGNHASTTGFGPRPGTEGRNRRSRSRACAMATAGSGCGHHRLAAAMLCKLHNARFLFFSSWTTPPARCWLSSPDLLSVMAGLSGSAAGHDRPCIYRSEA